MSKYAIPRKLFVISLLIAVACVALNLDSIRGTDQYWYLSDVETISSTGTPLSNIYYAGDFLRGGDLLSKPNYIMHNGPWLKPVAFIANKFGASRSWIGLNLLSHLMVGLCILIILRKITDSICAYTCASLYLVSPIAIWQSINLLQEQFYAINMALIAVCYVYRSNVFSMLALAVLLLIGTLSHPIFFAMALALCGVMIVTCGIGKRLLSVAVWGCFAIVVVVAERYKDHLFPSSFQPNLLSIIAGSIPGKSNMLWHFTDLNPAITLSLLKDKFLDSLSMQFLQPKLAQFYLYTNIAIFCFLWILYKTRYRYIQYLLPIALVVGLYFAMTFLFQNQPRYQQIIAPVTFCLIGLAIYGLPARYLQFFQISFLAITSVIASYLAYYVWDEANEHKLDNEKLFEIISSTAESDKFLAYGLMDSARWGYVAKPRRVLSIEPRLLTEAELTFLLNSFKPDYVLSRHTAEDLNIENRTIEEYEMNGANLFFSKITVEE